MPTPPRTYDTADDPTLHTRVDPVMGISSADVEAAVLGSFAGTYTPRDGAAFAIEVSLSVDGVITVQDHDDGPSTWSATLVFAMSSDLVDGRYLIDDLFSPELVLTSLTEAAVVGHKAPGEFDGAIGDTGAVQLEARFVAGGWSGTLAFGGAPHGAFTVGR